MRGLQSILSDRNMADYRKRTGLLGHAEENKVMIPLKNLEGSFHGLEQLSGADLHIPMSQCCCGVCD